MTTIEKTIIEVAAYDFQPVSDITKKVAEKLGYSVSDVADIVHYYCGLLVGRAELECIRRYKEGGYYYKVRKP